MMLDFYIHRRNHSVSTNEWAVKKASAKVLHKQETGALGTTSLWRFMGGSSSSMEEAEAFMGGSSSMEEAEALLTPHLTIVFLTSLWRFSCCLQWLFNQSLPSS